MLCFIIIHTHFGSERTHILIWCIETHQPSSVSPYEQGSSWQLPTSLAVFFIGNMDSTIPPAQSKQGVTQCWNKLTFPSASPGSLEVFGTFTRRTIAINHLSQKQEPRGWPRGVAPPPLRLTPLYADEPLVFHINPNTNEP